LLQGAELARELANHAGLKYSDEPLKHVFAAAHAKLGDKIHKLLEERFRHCTPSEHYLDLTKYAWPRIYTLNVDDALERASTRTRTQNYVVRGIEDRVEDQDQFFGQMDLVKLNGDVSNLRAGIVFSPQQYARAASKVSQWYEQLGVDFFRYTVLFIGTKLDESVFFQQIERYREMAKAIEGESYLIVPSVSGIERASLASQKIVHIPGNLSSFCEWLKHSFPTPLKPIQVAIARRPQIQKVFFDAKNDVDRHRYAKLFEFVERIDRSLPQLQRPESERGATREFYRGFKPAWPDIHEGVPAELEATRKFGGVVDAAVGKRKLVVLYGPAGSGKSTLLMQVAYRRMIASEVPVYFLTQPPENIAEVIGALEHAHSGPYLVFTDKLDQIAYELADAMKQGKLQKGTIVGSERQSIWISRTREHLHEFEPVMYRLSEIVESDAEAILKHVERFGPWQRLSKLKPVDRVNELVAKAKRQLLIGLLETTYGVGFEKLIEQDYKRLASDEERIFVTLIGLGTVHRSSIQESLVSRGLRNLGVTTGIPRLLRLTSGIVNYAAGSLYVRHPVYVRHLFEHVVNPRDTHKVVKGLLGAFAAYRVPIARYAGRNEAYLFKSILNHRFLADMLRGQADLIVDVYRSHEKVFQEDGLFWLQYGLALRDLDLQEDALSKLETSFAAYPSVHAEHALAQQKLIMARRTDTKAKAYTLLAEAKDALDRLDQVRELVDTYPLVTLSEGHAAIVLKFEGAARASQLAKEYLHLIDRRVREGKGGERLQQCKERLTKFAVNPSLATLQFK
jgi:tetratricopeptide (TPR) repeat protein